MLKITVLLMLLVVGFSFYAIGSQIADGLTHSNAGNDTQANSITQMEGWGYDYKTFESTITTKKITLMASDETLVPLYELSSKNESESKGVVLLVHGLEGITKVLIRKLLRIITITCLKTQSVQMKDYNY